MRNLMLALGALSLAVPVALTLPASKAQARDSRYHNRTYKRRCTHSKGTQGLVIGGVGGALVGNSVLGHGALGTVGGAAAGALAGRAVDRTITADRRCR